LNSKLQTNFFLNKFVLNKVDHADVCDFIEDAKKLNYFHLSQTRIPSSQELKTHLSTCKKLKKIVRHDPVMQQKIQEYVDGACNMLEQSSKNEKQLIRSEQTLKQLSTDLDAYIEKQLAKEKQEGIKQPNNKIQLAKDISETVVLMTKLKKSDLSNVKLNKNSFQKSVEKEFNKLTANEDDKNLTPEQRLKALANEARQNFDEETRKSIESWEIVYQSEVDSAMKEGNKKKLDILNVSSKIGKYVGILSKLSRKGFQVGKNLTKVVMDMNGLPPDMINYVMIAFDGAEMYTNTLQHSLHLQFNMVAAPMLDFKNIEYVNGKQFVRDWILYFEGYDENGNKIREKESQTKVMIEQALKDNVDTTIRIMRFMGDLFSLVPGESGTITMIIKMITNMMHLFSKVSLVLFYRTIFDMYLLLVQFLDFVKKRFKIDVLRFLFDPEFMKKQIRRSIEVVQKLTKDKDGNLKSGVGFLGNILERIEKVGMETVDKFVDDLIAMQMAFFVVPMVAYNKDYIKKKFKKDKIIQKVYKDIQSNDKQFSEVKDNLIKTVGDVASHVEFGKHQELQRSIGKLSNKIKEPKA